MDEEDKVETLEEPIVEDTKEVEEEHKVNTTKIVPRGMVMDKDESSLCSKCGGKMKGSGFYLYRDGSRMDICKKCLTMQLNNWDEDTFLWILEKMDFPYIKVEWDRVREKCLNGSNGQKKKISSISVLGKYLAKMRLSQFKKLGWADAAAYVERLAAAAPKQERESLDVLLEQGKITKAEYDTYRILPEQEYIPEERTDEPQPIKDTDLGLTKDDLVYLKLKWGNDYRQDQYVRLEDLFDKRVKAFSKTPPEDTLAVLKFVCKTEMKMNEALDADDFDSYLKLSRTYDFMRKSVKITAAQRKDEDESNITSIGQLVEICEREKGRIPRAIVETPMDKVDKTLVDLQNYLYKLVTQDETIGKQIEEVIKLMSENESSGDEEIEQLVDSDEDDILSDADIKEYASVGYDEDSDEEELEEELVITGLPPIKEEEDFGN